MSDRGGKPDFNGIEEFRRKIDYQIETNRRLEDRAERIVRIFYGALGILISVSFRLIEAGLSAVDYITSLEVDSISQKVGNTVVELNGEIVVIVSAAFALFAFITLFYNIFIFVPRIAYRVQKHSEMHSGPSLGEIDSYSTQGEIAEAYQKAIDQNAGVVAEAKQQMDQCWSRIRRTPLYAIAFILISLPLVLEHPIGIFGTFVVGICFMVYQTIETITTTESEIFQIFWRVDIIYAAATGFMTVFFMYDANYLISKPVSDVAALLTLISFLALVIMILLEGASAVIRLAGRSIILAIAGFYFVSFFFVLFSESFDFAVVFQAAALGFLATTVVALGASVTGSIAYGFLLLFHFGEYLHTEYDIESLYEEVNDSTAAGLRRKLLNRLREIHYENINSDDEHRSVQSGTG